MNFPITLSGANLTDFAEILGEGSGKRALYYTLEYCKLCRYGGEGGKTNSSDMCSVTISLVTA